METFLFDCPFCNAKIECEAELAGKMCKCPTCGKEITPVKKDNPPSEPVPEYTYVDNASDLADDNPAQDPCKNPGIAKNASNTAPLPPNTTSTVWAKMSQEEKLAWVEKNTPPKQRSIFVMLGLFFGIFGVHMFYIGNAAAGGIMFVMGAIGSAIITFASSDIMWGGVGLLIVDILGALTLIAKCNEDAHGRPMF